MKKSYKKRRNLKKTKKKSWKKGGARSPSRKARSPSRKARLSPNRLAKLEGDQLDEVLALSLITAEADQLRAAREAQPSSSKDALAQARELYQSSKAPGNALAQARELYQSSKAPGNALAQARELYQSSKKNKSPPKSDLEIARKESIRSHAIENAIRDLDMADSHAQRVLAYDRYISLLNSK